MNSRDKKKVWIFVYLRNLNYDLNGNEARITITNGNMKEEKRLLVQNNRTTMNDDEISTKFPGNLYDKLVTVNVSFYVNDREHKVLAPIVVDYLEYFTKNVPFVASLKDVPGEIVIKFNNSHRIIRTVSVFQVKNGEDLSKQISRQNEVSISYRPEDTSNAGTQVGAFKDSNKEFYAIIDFTASNATDHKKRDARGNNITINLHCEDFNNNPYLLTMLMLEEGIGSFFLEKIANCFGFGYEYLPPRQSFKGISGANFCSENLTQSLGQESKGIAACIDTYKTFLNKFVRTPSSAPECELSGPTYIYNVLQHVCRSNKKPKIVVIFTDGMILDMEKCRELLRQYKGDVKFLFVVVGPQSDATREKLERILSSEKGSYFMISSTQVESKKYQYQELIEYLF